MSAPEADTATEHEAEQDTKQDTPQDTEQSDQEVEQEREERLDPDNRPEGAEVDNTGDNMPDFVKEQHSGEGVDGTSDPGKAFRENPPSDEEVAEIEKEREERLDPDNRPDGAEVDNTSSSPGTNDDEPGTSD